MAPLRRTVTIESSALDADEGSPVRVPGAGAGGTIRPQPRRPSGARRVSVNSTLPHRPSVVGRLKNTLIDEEVGSIRSPKPERPAIPSALQPPPEMYATSLPTLSMIVLSITMLGEFLSANVSAPFLLFMVESFHQFDNEADVGKWTGILVSTFFLTQFLTSLLWATVAAKHGQRLVIGISLLGSAVTCTLFGTSTSIQQAIAIRLMQGVFAGAIGVARGAVTCVTDQTNEGRAYAILGFCWGFGGVAGAIVGGSFENPAKKWPGTFSSIPLFVNYPYLLPCIVASAVTLTGSVLSLFLGPDCGPRQGAIRLPLEKFSSGSVPPIPEEETPPVTPTEEEPAGVVRSLARKVSRKLSGAFGTRKLEEPLPASTSMPVPLAAAPSRARAFSRTSVATGSAYGYGGSYRNRAASFGTIRAGTGRRGSMASWRFRRDSVTAGDGSLSASVATGSDMNFAQRLLMANENTVTNIADLWVASAMNTETEDVFDDDEWEYGSQVAENALDVTPGEEFDETETFETGPPRSNRFIRSDSVGSPSIRAGLIASPRRPSTSTHRDSSAGTRRVSGAPSTGNLEPSVSQSTVRRYSTTTAPIFSHVGVRTPPAVIEAQHLLSLADAAEAAGQDGLAPIAEGQSAIHGEAPAQAITEPSLMSQLPLLIIFQYGVLALHSTTHDQVFYLYLVSKYPSGGLNLNAGHFSQLIALMCLAQIVYQFYFYPNIGPPRGRFSHLAMFRIGSLLYIPAYVSVVLYRVFASASDDGNLILMAALAISTAIRFCAITFSYTAIAVLLNYMSPPHIVGYANGIAQSIVSLARFFGPVLGGMLWSMSVQDNPSGYPLGFLVCSVTCGLAVAHSFFIR